MSTGQKEQSMSLGRILAAEMQQESISLRKMLERLPNEKLAWQPHEKSMNVEQLAGHIVNMISWTGVTLGGDELDFAKMDYKPKVYTDSTELVADLDANLAEALEALNNATDETLAGNWSLRNGEQIFFTMPKTLVMRTFVMNHIIHHRGQLAVYMRLLDVPVPSIYGPSADEQM